MTLTCRCRLNGSDGEITCPFCNNEACNACLPEPHSERCNHDEVTRHPAIRESIDELAVNRTPTRPMPPLPANGIVFQLDDVRDLLEFFRKGADILEASMSGCRVTVIIEQIPVDHLEDKTPP